MRILDKNHDFYDYLQGIYRDNTFTFERANSYELTKQTLCEDFNCFTGWNDKNLPRFMLLQVCNTFWLFIISCEYNKYYRIEKYSCELLAKWKNYNKPSALMELSIIEFKYPYSARIKFIDSIRNNADTLMMAINQNEYRDLYSYTHASWMNGRMIPLLKSCGLAPCIEALDIYLAFEEYFSRQKQAQERTESKGLTDKEKIENHGFNTKKSFRGKK